MLQQLSQLSLDTDGRYASSSELQFLKDYVESAETRISVYQKIRDAEDTIIDSVESMMLQEDPFIFRKGSQDITALYQRDTKNIMRCTAAAVLTDDLDRLRDTFLLWHKTIVKAFNVSHLSKAAYQHMPSVLKSVLTDEELKRMLPAIYLDQTVFDE